MRVLAFFYGSYMDPDILRRFGADPPAPRKGHVDGWRLAFTPHANMVHETGGRVQGVLYALPHDELDRLYGPDGFVTTYRPVPVLAHGPDGPLPAMTFIEDAPEQDPEPEYVAAFRAIQQKMGVA